jgi:LacI family gluconate utilization system Gnt-I transcriptional repressor
VLCAAPATFSEGSRGLTQLLQELSPDTDAVFCGNDSIAAGVLFECVRRKIPVPHRIAIVGFADLPIAAETVPTLTSVKVEGREIGASAGRMLLARLSGNASQNNSVDLGFQIMARDSA